MGRLSALSARPPTAYTGGGKLVKGPCMSRSARPACLVALTVVLVAAAAVPAAANTYSVRDGHDISNSSALDILSAKVGHKDGKLLHAVVLERSVAPSSLARIGGFVVFMLDTDGDKDIERRVYVIGGSKFRAFVTNGSGRDIISRASVYHPNARTLGATFNDGLLHADGYQWFSAAVTDGPGDCCIDFAHDKYFFIHDFTPPQITSFGAGIGDFTAVPDTTVPITWNATDTGLAGLGPWAVREREDGSTIWQDLATGRFPIRDRVTDGTKTTNFIGEEGRTYEVCLSLLDWMGNRATSGRYAFSIPYDDDTEIFDYSQATTAQQPAADAFGGSVTVVSEGTVTINVPGGGGLDLYRGLVLPGGFDGRATISVNSMGSWTLDESFSYIDGPRSIIFLDGPIITETITIEIITGGSYGFAIDGYLGGPVYVGETPYDNCGGPPPTPTRSTTWLRPSPKFGSSVYRLWK